jgi:hypothetical protein
VTVPSLNIALLRATFADWHIVAHGQAWRATRQHAENVTACSHRFAAVGQPELTASTPADLAIQLAALEYPLGITPTS